MEETSDITSVTSVPMNVSSSVRYTNKRSSVVVRPPMNQDEFDKTFVYQHPSSEESFAKKHMRKYLHSYFDPFTSWQLFKAWILSLIPILDWLTCYNIQENLSSDFIGGLTVGVMQVPQGLAYALLAKQNAMVGLYTSLFPPLLYMIFGTSRHNSIGSFAVVSLMTGIAVTKLTDAAAQQAIDAGKTNVTISFLKESGIAPTPLEVASALIITVGAIELLMGFLRLSFLTTYLSDQVVAGFTTGASCHVFVSQIKDLFGIRNLRRRMGPGYLIMHLYDLLRTLPKTNLVTLTISILTIAILHIGKEYVNPIVKRKTKNVPIPLEIIVMLLGTVFSQLLDLHKNFAVKIIGHIPTGLPSVSVPRIDLVPDIFDEALGITIVTVAIHMSLAKMFAKKLNYKIDAGQELIALSFCSLGSSVLPVYPVSCSLGRTLVNVEAGTKTQLSTVFGSVFVVAVAFYFGKFLEPLPMCVLASIVVVALKGMIQKFSDLRTLWPLSKIDFSIWVVSFAATVLIDVSEGLIISIFYALFTTVIREQWPRWHLLANVKGTTDYRDSERYQDVCFYSGICMFRFDSPLLFTNVERFKQTVKKAYQEWEKSQEFFVLMNERQAILMQTDIRDNIEKMAVVDLKNIEKTEEPRSPDMQTRVEQILSRHFIIDCSGFTFVDYMGVSALKEIYCEMRSRGILVYFAAAKAPVRELFELSGFYSFVAKENFYPTMRDAVAIARKRQLESGKKETVFVPEFDRLSELIGSQPLD